MFLVSETQSHALLLIKQIGMAPCSFKPNHVSADFVEQQPIRLDMGISKTTPITLQGMVPVASGQFRPCDEQAQQGLEFVHVLAATLSLFHIALELAGVFRLSHAQIPIC